MQKIAYLGIKGHVVAFELETGKERWRTHLKGGQLTNVAETETVILAYAVGHLFGLSPENGTILLKNELEGLGYGYAILGVSGSGAISSAAQQASSSAAVAAVVATSAAS